jgi:hypothetical protein
MHGMKFTLRDLLWFVLVAGIGCAWWLEHRSAAALRDSHRRAVTLERLMNESGFTIDWKGTHADVFHRNAGVDVLFRTVPLEESAKRE